MVFYDQQWESAAMKRFFLISLVLIAPISAHAALLEIYTGDANFLNLVAESPEAPITFNGTDRTGGILNARASTVSLGVSIDDTNDLIRVLSVLKGEVIFSSPDVFATEALVSFNTAINGLFQNTTTTFNKNAFVEAGLRLGSHRFTFLEGFFPRAGGASRRSSTLRSGFRAWCR